MDQIALEFDQEIKSDGDCHPDCSPSKGFPEGKDMRSLLEKTKVNDQH